MRDFLMSILLFGTPILLFIWLVKRAIVNQKQQELNEIKNQTKIVNGEEKIICHWCKSEIGKGATICPYCKKNPTKTGNTNRIIEIIIGILLILYAISKLTSCQITIV